MEAIVERFHVWCPEKGLPGNETHPLFFQAKGRIESVSTNGYVFGEHDTEGEGAVSFEEVLDQAIAMLQRRGRLTYRTLQRQFHLDAEALEDLTVELIKGQRLAVDEDGEVLVWTGEGASAPAPA